MQELFTFCRNLLVKGAEFMSRTVSFYNYAIKKNGKPTSIQAVELIRMIYKIPWSNRLRLINDHPTGIFETRSIKLDEKNRFLSAALGKFRRDYKPFMGDLGTQRLAQIPGDIVEIVYMLVDLNYQVIMLEFNQHGIRAGGLEEYFNSFFPEQNDQNWSFHLPPIFSRKGLGDIAGSDQIRAIEIKLKLSKFEEDLITVKENSKKESNIIPFILSSKKAESLAARTVRLEFGVGQSKDHTMDIDSVMNLLHLLNIQSDAIDTLRVRFKDGKSKKMDTVDLKNSGGQLKDRIFENEHYTYPTLQLVGDAMANKYVDNLGTIEEEYRIHKRNQIAALLPTLISDPPACYYVKQEDVINE